MPVTGRVGRHIWIIVGLVGVAAEGKDEKQDHDKLDRNNHTIDKSRLTDAGKVPKEKHRKKKTS